MVGPVVWIFVIPLNTSHRITDEPFTYIAGFRTAALAPVPSSATKNPRFVIVAPTNTHASKVCRVLVFTRGKAQNPPPVSPLGDHPTEGAVAQVGAVPESVARVPAARSLGSVPRPSRNVIQWTR